MRQPKVLIIGDKKDLSLLDNYAQNMNWDILWYLDDYKNLHRNIPEIKRLAVENKIDLLMYSRNDQIGERYSIGKVTRQTCLGYSSFSGIDENYSEQMVECFRDFLNCPIDWTLLPARSEQRENQVSAESLANKEGTYSFIFDTEQIACAKYGIPRLLPLLEKYNIKSTFFITNLIHRIYPNLISSLIEAGHEIGIHGLYHEFLCTRKFEEQSEIIKEMIDDLQVKISGSNFIGRMDQNTMEALSQNGIRYFTYDSIAHHRRLGYAKGSLLPSLQKTTFGDIWAIPVTVSTYSNPFFTIRNMVTTSIRQGKRQNYTHFNIICHPFRDGNLKNLRISEQLMEYLSNLGYQGVTIKQHLKNLRIPEHDKTYCSESTNILNPKHKMLVMPSTTEDFCGIFFENILAVYKLIRRGRNVY